MKIEKSLRHVESETGDALLTTGLVSGVVALATKAMWLTGIPTGISSIELGPTALDIQNMFTTPPDVISVATIAAGGVAYAVKRLRHTS